MSPAPLSVVIPTLNAAQGLGPTLGMLAEGATSGLIREVIFSDGGSSDGIEEIAMETGAALITGPPGRGRQLARGAAAARGEWLLFLHGDTVLQGDWMGEIRRHIARRPGKAGYFRLAFDAEGFGSRWVAGWANWRSWLFSLPYGDQGLLISRALYQSSGGYPDIPLMEDVALDRKLGWWRLRMMRAVALTGAQRYLKEGWYTRGKRNWGCLILYFRGESPDRIAERYRG